jgi:hypothetical protein
MSSLTLRVAAHLLLAVALWTPGPAAGAEPARTPDAGSTPVPSGGPSPTVTTPIVSAEAQTEAGSLPLSVGAETLVDPAARFRVTLSVASRDARLALLDAADAHVPASGTTEVAGGTTVLTLAPSEPLRPGGRYQLRVDGATGRALTSEDGRAFGPASLAVVAAGTPAPERKAPERKRRR